MSRIDFTPAATTATLVRPISVRVSADVHARFRTTVNTADPAGHENANARQVSDVHGRGNGGRHSTFPIPTKAGRAD